jgi:adenylate cyclase
MALIGIGALMVALAVGVAVAQGVTAPVATLVTGMREVLQGNLGHRVAVRRRDEIGFLATSFNEMTGGLEERARIRDVMDKVVSPEVAHAPSRASHSAAGPRGHGAFADLD